MVISRAFSTIYTKEEYINEFIIVYLDININYFLLFRLYFFY